MAHGMADWGSYAPISSVYKGMDLSELATRIGSVVGFDRGGNALFVDDCSSGLTKWRVIEGFGSKVRPQYGYNIFGGYSIRLDDDGTDTSRAEIYTGLPLYQNVSTGLELVANFVFGKTVVILVLEFDNGSVAKQFKVRLSNKSGSIEVLGHSNTWQTVGSFVPMNSGAMWTFFLKMIVDEGTNKYKTIRLNQQIIDAGSYSCYEAGSITANNITLRVVAGYEEANSSGGINVNSVIFTINE